MCDDVHAAVAERERKGAEFKDGVADRGWGLPTTLKFPSSGFIGLYQQQHPTAISTN